MQYTAYPIKKVGPQKGKPPSDLHKLTPPIKVKLLDR